MSKGKTYSVDFITQFVFLFYFIFFFNFRELECAGVNVNKPSGGICQSENEDVSLSSKDNL